MRIYLMRHGETDWNREGRLQGRMDIAMNATGIRQMQEAGAGLRDRGISFDKILASPLRRAVESAEIIAGRVLQGRYRNRAAFDRAQLWHGGGGDLSKAP